MSDSPEATPHLTRARALLQGLLSELREARLAHEADHTWLSSCYQAGLRLDNDLEEVEIR